MYNILWPAAPHVLYLLVASVKDTGPRNGVMDLFSPKLCSISAQTICFAKAEDTD